MMQSATNHVRSFKFWTRKSALSKLEGQKHFLHSPSYVNMTTYSEKLMAGLPTHHSTTKHTYQLMKKINEISKSHPQTFHLMYAKWNQTKNTNVVMKNLKISGIPNEILQALFLLLVNFLIRRKNTWQDQLGNNDTILLPNTSWRSRRVISECILNFVSACKPGRTFNAKQIIFLINAERNGDLIQTTFLESLPKVVI